MEDWINLQNYEEYYEISNIGNIRRKEGTFNRKIKNLGLRKHSGGYLYFQITINNISKNLTYHRVMAQHFIPNPENKPFVNHKDGNKLNNSLDNLEWVTASENMRHAYDTGLEVGKKGEEHHNSKYKEEEIKNIKLLFKNGVSRKEISKLYPKMHINYLTLIINNKRWSHITI